MPIGGIGGLADALGAAGPAGPCAAAWRFSRSNKSAAGVTLSAWTADGREVELTGDRVLAAVAPAVVQRWFGREWGPR